MRIIKYGFFTSILTYAIGIIVCLVGFEEIGSKILMYAGFSTGGFAALFLMFASILGRTRQDDFDY